MNDIWHRARSLEIAQALIDKHLHIRPELGFTQVALGAEWNTHDISLLRNLLLELGVVVRHLIVNDLSSNQVNPLNVIALGERTGKFQDIACLSAGVFVAAQFKFFAADQAVKADQCDA